MTRPDEHDPIARAATALDLPPDVTGAVASAEFLRKLPAENFAPPEEWVAALNRLAGTGLPLTPDALATEADELRSDVDAFAAAFWELPPDDRRAKWSALYARCADKSNPIAAFLRHLEAGLGMTVVAHPNKVADELAGLVRELFVLRPRVPGRSAVPRGWPNGPAAANAGRTWPGCSRPMPRRSRLSTPG
jgi:hypothetical protein